MDLKYCNNECQKGKKASKDFLDNNNSAYDAALDFMRFTEKCFETCPYKEVHT
jgi:hypothetical protein